MCMKVILLINQPLDRYFDFFSPVMDIDLFWYMPLLDKAKAMNQADWPL